MLAGIATALTRVLALQLDALLSSTVDSAGPPFPTDNAPVLDVAPFDFEEFMISFGNEGPASYDPTQSFDLAV